jgi:AcrR family transcriptional regulator
VTRRGDLTKKRLLDTAERLYAERGVDAVSLRDINAAAGERNNAALYYHFHDRAGLLQALSDRHLPHLAARQQELLEQAELENHLDDLRSMVEVIVRPSAEYIVAGPSQRAWLRLAADLATSPAIASEDISTASSAAAWTAGARIHSHLVTECGLPNAFARQRIWTAMESAMHAVASRARDEETPGRRRSAPPVDLFTEDLLDTTCAALSAPISRQTRRVLAAQGRQGTEKLAKVRRSP